MRTAIARFIALIALGSISFFAYSRETVPVIDYDDNIVMVGSGNLVTVDQVKNAIVAAAQAHNWQISRSPNADVLQALLQVRGKHTVVVNIAYSAQAYSIKYQSSSNMKYSYTPETNTRVIHPFYNRWVSELREAIRMELSRI